MAIYASSSSGLVEWILRIVSRQKRVTASGETSLMSVVGGTAISLALAAVFMKMMFWDDDDESEWNFDFVYSLISTNVRKMVEAQSPILSTGTKRDMSIVSHQGSCHCEAIAFKVSQQLPV